MFGWDFEVNAQSRFWNCNMSKICELWSCDMNSTLWSVVPLAMFSYKIILPFPFTFTFSFVNAWLNWPLLVPCLKNGEKSFLLLCCPVSQILISSAFVNSERGARDRFQMIFMSVPREFKRAVPAQQNQPDLIGWDWKKVQIAPTLIAGCNYDWSPTLYAASWLHWFQAFLEDCHHATMGKLGCTPIATSGCFKKEKN